ncbi:MAG: hypothetical protein HOW73_25495 [Polyangiaceae bacterium]|nr:hypothetical protein [Polyangiaceae bacterium]
MTTKPLTFALLTLFVGACAPAAPATEPAETAEPVETAPAETAEPAATASAAPAETAPAAAPKPTKEELEKAMTPAAGVTDVRPIIGTDPGVALPAVFAQVKKGMTAKELDAIFPGVGAVPKIEFINFTKQGTKWIRVKGTQKHKELLDIEYDDAGGVKKIGYMFDPATVKPEFWDYLKKSAVAKWGKTDMTNDLLTWKVEGIQELAVHRSDDKTYTIGVTY